MRQQKRGIKVLGVEFNPIAIKRWQELGLDTAFGDATDPELISELPLPGAGWIVSTIPVHHTGLSHEETRATLMQLARTSGFCGRIAAASYHAHDMEHLFASGAELVLEPFQDVADRAVDLLCGAPEMKRTEFPMIESEVKDASSRRSLPQLNQPPQDI